MAKAHLRYLQPQYQDSAESGRLILRDGSTAWLRTAKPDDGDAIAAFFKSLSSESRRHRFFSPADPDSQTLLELCDGAPPKDRLTLLAFRGAGKSAKIIAVASYYRKDETTAEVAFAVKDTFHGKGLGSILLERLALLASRQGFTRFWAVTHSDNRPMIEVFRRSGFTLRERPGEDSIEVEFPLTATPASSARAESLDRLFTATSLRPFFHPRSVAVIGASRDAGQIGHRIVQALIANHFQGPVYPINPRAEFVSSIKAYPRIQDVPDPVDLAVISVPRDLVLPSVDDCAEKGVKGLIVISAGFAETGAEGKLLQQQLAEKVRGYGMRIVGPNCLGVINTDPAVQMNASFSPVYPPHGKTAMLSQSGALGIAILSLANQKQLGLSHFVSIGNKADVSGNDLLQYWEQDPATQQILFYLESFGNPRRFSRIARRVSRTKPIVVVKGGRTGAGSRAAGSHTAALAANDVAVEALFKQTGVIRVDALERLFDVAALLSTQPLPPGKRVAIVTNAGGPGILCADACETGGLQVAELAEPTRKKLAEYLPPAASLANPVDMIASAPPEHYRRTIAHVLAAKEVDALIVLYIPVGSAPLGAFVDAIRDGIQEGRKAGAAGKPVLSCLMGEEGYLPRIAVGEESVPNFVFPESPAQVLAQVAEYAAWRAQPQGAFVDFDGTRPERARSICQDAVHSRGEGWLTTLEARDVLLALGLPVSPGEVAKTADEAASAAKRLEFPVAVKLASHMILHKTEHQAVHLNLADEAAVRRAFDAIRKHLEAVGQIEAMEGVLVQPMVKGGVEVMVGVVEDPAFGPLIAFGLGGVHVEILRDVSFRVSPLTDRDATEMVREIRGFRLLEGYRGHAPADIPAIEEMLLRISLLVEEVPEIVELDLNPVFALEPGQGCRIVDARIRVQAATGLHPDRILTSPFAK